MNAMTLSNRSSKIEEIFAQKFGSNPMHWFRAPGRVDLMGSHTDYNQGCVLTCTINRDTWIAAAPRDDDRVELVSTNMNSRASFRLGVEAERPNEKWAVYIQAVAIILESQGYQLKGFNGVIDGNLPLGSGLSSSASLEVATAVLFSNLSGFDISPLDMAKTCQKAENEIVGVNCGILDQYSSVMGARHMALLLDCRNLTHVKADFPRDTGLVICNTCAPRELSGSEYGERRANCEEGVSIIQKRFPEVQALRDVSLEQFEPCKAGMPETAAKRCQFIIEENARVHELADALSKNDKQRISSVTAASFAGARDLFEISVPAMQAMMDAMNSAPGVIGARQSGAGFGGCMLSFVEKTQEEQFIEHVSKHYAENFGIEPEIYPIRTSDGAGVLKVSQQA